MPASYRGLQLDCGYRLDLVVDDKVVLEIKDVESLAPIRQSQLMTYLRLSGLRAGLLMNFNVVLMKDGIKRIVLWTTCVLRASVVNPSHSKIY